MQGDHDPMTRFNRWTVFRKTLELARFVAVGTEQYAAESSATLSKDKENSLILIKLP
jgi:nicotinic acid mononucleotide adenylyltransferase